MFEEGYGAVTSKTNKQTNKQTPLLIRRHSLFVKPIEMKEFNQNKASRAENNNFFLYSQQ
jgi:hypothetical protein